jgi:SIR2-like domain
MSKPTSFWDILSHLSMLQRRGLLVPFIGSGMSLPACRSWQPFVVGLADAVGTPVPGELQISNKSGKFFSDVENAGIEIPKELKAAQNANQAVLLVRLADQVMEALRPLPFTHRCRLLNEALTEKPGPAPIPSQTMALAQIAWPLVVTTNYDDLYWYAANASAPKAGHVQSFRPDIVGRSLNDCHRVLESLAMNSPRLLWALQGFVGGQAGKAEESIADSHRRDELARQVVLGHQQYQAVINGEPHFRRAFAEVLRRRSLLFIGSGLLEDYIVNLLSEIVHHHGIGPLPHYSLFHKDKQNLFDSGFLERRLGIVPIFYDSYDDLPKFLSDLAAVAKGQAPRESAAARIVTARPREVSFEIVRPTLGKNLRCLTVTIHDRGLPKALGPHECSAVSLGRGEENKAISGSQSVFHFASLGTTAKQWKLLEGSKYTFRNDDSAVFGIAARIPNVANGVDRRDLSIIPDAVCEALALIDRCKDSDDRGFTKVSLGAVASGPGAPWHQIHPFAQMLRGIRQFSLLKDASQINTIEICLVGWQVWDEVISGRIPVGQLLSTDIIWQRVDLISSDGAKERAFQPFEKAPTLLHLMKACGANRQQWKPDIVPRPTVQGTTASEPADDTPIAPTMTVVLTAR